MRTPSRFMPPYEPQSGPLGLKGWIIIALLFGGLLILLREVPWLLLLAPISVAWGYIDQKRRNKKFDALQQRRQGESICGFARSFDRNSVDTWIVRAVYEQVQQNVFVPGMTFPIRASDTFDEVLEIDSDDLDMGIVEEVAWRTGRSLEDIELNPYCGRVKTVGDLVHFFNAQPLIGRNPAK